MLLLFYVCKSHYFFFGILILIEIARINIRLSSRSNPSAFTAQKNIVTSLNDTKVFYSNKTKSFSENNKKTVVITQTPKKFLTSKVYKIFNYKQTEIELPTQCPAHNWQMLLNDVTNMYSKITKISFIVQNK